MIRRGFRGREKLTANRTYYVRTDGSNSNSGLEDSAAGAFLTIQKAVDVVLTLDLGGFAVTIQVGAGTYTGVLLLEQPFVGGLVTIVGDPVTPSNVLWSTVGITCRVAGRGVRLALSGLKLQSSALEALRVGYGAYVNLSGATEWGPTAAAHMMVELLGHIEADANYAISGNAQIHLQSGTQGLLDVQGRTVTLLNTPNWTTRFAHATGMSTILAASTTWTGAATGQRYSASYNAIISVGGAGSTFLPGDVAGTTSLGGIYA